MCISLPWQVATPLRNELAATTAKTLRQRRSSAGGAKESGAGGAMRIDGADGEDPDWGATAQRTASGGHQLRSGRQGAAVAVNARMLMHASD